jgi:hypothetical protein
LAPRLIPHLSATTWVLLNVITPLIGDLASRAAAFAVRLAARTLLVDLFQECVQQPAYPLALGDSRAPGATC